MEATEVVRAEDLLQHHPDYPVLLIYRSKRRPYMEFSSRCKLAEPEEIISSQITQFPVPLLPVFDGLQCLGPASCKYLCVSVKRMRNHWQTVHGKPVDGNGWRAAPLQTFFRGNLLRYFTNTKVHTATGSDTCLCQSERPPKHNSKQTIQPFTPTLDLTTSLDDLLEKEVDQYLFNHYLTSTYMTLVDRHGSEEIWQTVVPQMARDNSFLMHALLACSALHLAYQRPSEQQTYLVHGHSHQNLAMPLFRRAIENVTESNCHAILAFCYLLVIYSFAADRDDERLLLADESSPNPNLLCSWLYFVRNSCFVVCGLWHLILTGPFGSIVKSWDAALPRLEGSSTKSTVTEHFVSLMPSDDPRENITGWSDHVRRVYRDTAADLAFAFAAAKVFEEEGFTTWDAVRMWPMIISVSYIELLNEGHPAALGLLAHYCLLLEKIQPHWYFEGRGQRLLSTVLERMEPGWRSKIEASLAETSEALLGGIR